MTWADAAENDQIKPSFGDLTSGATAEKLDGNFCRAFKADDAEPWCFVLGFANPGDAKQPCNVPACPEDGPWAKDYHQEAKDAAVPCTTEDGIPVEDCDCSCATAGTRSFIQTSTGETRICYC